MFDWLIFALFLFVGYAGTCAAVPRRVRATATPSGEARAEAPAEFESDAACRLLLGLASAEEARALQSRCGTDTAFAAAVQERRDELIRDYASGRLADRPRELFRKSMLRESGVAEQVEVERALAAVGDREFERLGTKLTYKLRKVDSLWRKLTLPAAEAPAGDAAGPCLMIGPDAESDAAELVGAVTKASEDWFETNLGMQNGLGPGDYLQVEGAEDEWIGTGVITWSDEAHCRALFMGERMPVAGDRVKAILEGDVL